MLLKPWKTNGGVCKHAVDRIKNQYGSGLDKRHIRRILREAKKRSGVSDGRAVIDEELIKELGIGKSFAERVLIIAIGNDDVVTVIDSPLGN